MGTLVDDLLHLARLDQGRPLERAPVDLVPLAADAVRDAQAVDPDRDRHGRGRPAPVVVLGDEARLRQVVANLVANALVHAPGAPSRCACRRRGRARGRRGGRRGPGHGRGRRRPAPSSASTGPTRPAAATAAAAASAWRSSRRPCGPTAASRRSPRAPGHGHHRPVELPLRGPLVAAPRQRVTLSATVSASSFDLRGPGLEPARQRRLRRSGSLPRLFEVERLGRADERRGHERARHAGRRAADEGGQHRGRRREVHRAADDGRADRRCSRTAGSRGTRRRRSAAVTGLSVRASSTKNEPPRNPPIWGMKFVSVDQSAAMGASGTPRSEPGGEDHEAVEHGDEQRAGEVAAEGLVDDLARPRRPAPGATAARWRGPGARSPRRRRARRGR